MFCASLRFSELIFSDRLYLVGEYGSITEPKFKK